MGRNRRPSWAEILAKEGTLYEGDKIMQLANELFAWVIVDPSGTHGIITMHTPDGKAMPTISSKREIMEGIRFLAEEVTAELKLPVQLRHFKSFEVLDEVKPQSH